MNTPQKFESEKQLRTMTKTMTELPLLVRNYSFFIAAAAFSSAAACFVFLFYFCLLSFFFQSLAHFMSTNTKPSGTMGDTQETMTVSATSFRRYNRFSPLLYISYLQAPLDTCSRNQKES